jgi:hypothetical protein
MSRKKKTALNEEERLRYDGWLQYKKESDEKAGRAASMRNTALITIAGGGLYVILEEMRYIQPQSWTCI